MGIGSVKGLESMSGRAAGRSLPTDPAVKNIRKEISDVQRQRQELSSKEDLPVSEKAKKRQELQQEISSLNRELMQRQAEARRKQQKKALAGENRADIANPEEAEGKSKRTDKITVQAAAGNKAEGNGPEPKDAGRVAVPNVNTRGAGVSTENVDDKPSQEKKTQEKKAQEKNSQLQDIEIPKKAWKAAITSDASREKLKRQESVIARIEGGIAILKSEIRLDEARGADVAKKQEELKKQEDKLQKASAPQLPSPDQFGKTAEKPAQAAKAANPSTENAAAWQLPLFQDVTVSLMT